MNKNAEESKPEGDKVAAETPAEDAKAVEYREKLLRLRADFENTKKRLEKDQAEAVKFANERLLIDILPIVDNLDRAMASLGEGHDVGLVKKGLEIAQKELHDVLESHGVEKIESVGTPFDPRFHEAVAAVETEGMEEGHVVDEMQKGYLLNGRLVRPSRVRVARKAMKNEE